MRKTKIKLQKRFDSNPIDLKLSRKIRNLKDLSIKFKRTGWIEPIR